MRLDVSGFCAVTGSEGTVEGSWVVALSAVSASSLEAFLRLFGPFGGISYKEGEYITTYVQVIITTKFKHNLTGSVEDLT